MRYLALIIGHTKKDGGARGVNPLGMQEYEYNTIVAKIAQQVGLTVTNIPVTVEIFYRDDGGVVGAYSRAVKWLDSKEGHRGIIELHFNAANGVATGTETLYADVKDLKGVKEKFFAECMQAEMCACFGRTGTKNRGLKLESGKKGERGYQNLSQTLKYPSVLVEPFFGDVASEADMADRLKKQYAEALIKGFVKFTGV